MLVSRSYLCSFYLVVDCSASNGEMFCVKREAFTLIVDCFVWWCFSEAIKACQVSHRQGVTVSHPDWSTRARSVTLNFTPYHRTLKLLNISTVVGGWWEGLVWQTCSGFWDLGHVVWTSVTWSEVSLVRFDRHVWDVLWHLFWDFYYTSLSSSYIKILAESAKTFDWVTGFYLELMVGWYDAFKATVTSGTRWNFNTMSTCHLWMSLTCVCKVLHYCSFNY